jgi:hypothetical protein
MTVQCAGCNEVVPIGDTVAYWPVDDPSDVRYVCRPDITKLNPLLSPEGRDCFRRMVADQSIHTIAAPAKEGA